MYHFPSSRRMKLQGNTKLGCFLTYQRCYALISSLCAGSSALVQLNRYMRQLTDFVSREIYGLMCHTAKLLQPCLQCVVDKDLKSEPITFHSWKHRMPVYGGCDVFSGQPLNSCFNVVICILVFSLKKSYLLLGFFKMTVGKIPSAMTASVDKSTAFSLEKYQGLFWVSQKMQSSGAGAKTI